MKRSVQNESSLHHWTPQGIVAEELGEDDSWKESGGVRAKGLAKSGMVKSVTAAHLYLSQTI